MNALKIGNLSHLWEDVCNLIIRPQRCVYEPTVALGPKLFTLGNRIFERKDLVVSNGRDLKLQCSHYQPIESQRPTEKLPCVIYCHGNCGSRCDALDAVQVLLPYNITVLAFDFSGSGMSDGDFVSLGYYEKQDVKALVDYLWGTKRVSRIGLWGRSMGAATSIMYTSMDTSIAGIVVDSPFVSLEELIQELVLSNQAWVPRKLIKVGVGIMKRSIQSRAGFNIRENCPMDKAGKCYVPCLFAHAEGDDFIRIHHSEKLYEAYGGDKNLIRFEGDHNSERPEFFYDSVCIFFYNTLISNDPDLDKGVEKATEPSSPRKVLLDAEIGTLPQSPHHEQIRIPPSALTDHPIDNRMEQEYLMRALIESVRDEIKLGKDDEEVKKLNIRLEELVLQAKQNGIDLNEV